MRDCNYQFKRSTLSKDETRFATGSTSLLSRFPLTNIGWKMVTVKFSDSKTLHELFANILLKIHFGENISPSGIFLQCDEFLAVPSIFNLTQRFANLLCNN